MRATEYRDEAYLNLTSAAIIPAPPKHHQQSPRLSRTASLAPKQSQDPSRSSSSTGCTSAIRKHRLLEIRIPSVPHYVPNTELSKELVEQKLAAVTLADDRRDGTILSRFTTEAGGVGFTVGIHCANSAERSSDAEEIDVDLANIYCYVTPAELERYEHRELELDAEREANRPKVGRPRKRSPGIIISTEIMGEENRTKKPLGRPRKRPATSNDYPQAGPAKRTRQPRQVFAGVHIPSPVKASQTSFTIPSKPTSTVASSSMSRDQFPAYTRDNSSASGQEGTSESGDTRINVDQLTPSNARKVIGVPQRSLTQRAHRPAYSMVKAALSESEMEDDLPQSPSEDELSALIPTTQQRRFSAVSEVAESVPSEAEDPITISSDSTSPHDQERVSRLESVDEDVEMLLDDHEAVGDSLDDHDILLQQFQANNTRRLISNSRTFTDQTRSILFHAPEQPKLPVQVVERRSHQDSNSTRSAPIHPQTTPTHSRHSRRSMTPRFPSAGKATGKSLEPRMRGGLMNGSLGSPSKRHVPVFPVTNDNQITLGSQETLSSDGDRQKIHDTLSSRHPASYNDAPLVDQEGDVTLGTPDSSSSSETNSDVSMEQETTIGSQHHAAQTKSHEESSSGPSSIANRWFGGMPWR
ncbi:MAG: hypothetical protein Q9226_003864 [Calogaya cf. arnoldii]